MNTFDVPQDIRDMLSGDSEMFWKQPGPFAITECTSCEQPHVNTAKLAEMKEGICPNCFMLMQLRMFAVRP